MANKNTRTLSARQGLDNNLFERIADLADKNEEKPSFQALAKEFMIDDSVVFGASTFYDFIKPEARQHKVRVCAGTACMVAGTQDKIHHQLSDHFSSEEIGHAACVGRCHTNSAIMTKDNTYSINGDIDLVALIQQDQGQTNDYHVGCNTTPILTGELKDIPSMIPFAKSYIDKTQEAIDELKTSNLRGRGGAGFPFWFKLDAVIKEKATQKYIVCNADEGDPGAFSDMYLLEQQPDKVLFGMYLSGLVVGADTAVLHIRGEYPDSIRAVAAAIARWQQIEGFSNFKFKIIRGQGSYVCGEETALLNSIEGLRPEVRVRPPYPAQYGLFGKPTVLSNVETFANIYWISQNGGQAYADLGTDRSTGTKLVSLDSFFNRPGIYELEMGTPLTEVFEVHGQGLKQAVKAWQVGGPLGGIIPQQKIQELTLDFESLNNNNFLLGHASFVSIPEDYPMIKFLEHLLAFASDESCGKCYPCRIGTFRGKEMLQKAQKGDYKIDRTLLDDLLETLEIGSLCALGGGVPLPIKNALTYFDEELKTYFQA